MKKFLLFIIFGQIFGDLINLETIEVTQTSDENFKTYKKSGQTSFISSDQISKNRGSSVADFLSQIPGVFTTNKRNSGAVTINIRGIQNENRVPFFIDGAMQSIPSWQGYAGSSTRTYIDPDLISSVSINKGGDVNVAGAIGGVVNAKTLSYEDIIKDGQDYGFLLKMGTMSNTKNKPSLYTRGGLRTKWIQECLTNDSGKCQKQTYDTKSNYQSKNLFHNLGKSFNGSLAFAKKWDNGDFVLAYARKLQGNYYAGKKGSTPKYKIDDKPHAPNKWGSIDNIEDDFVVGVNKNKWHIIGGKHKRYETYEEKVLLGKLIFEENPGYTYYRAGEEVLNSYQDNKSYLAKFNLYDDFNSFGISYLKYLSNFGELMPSQTSIRSDGALQGEGSEVEVDLISLEYKFNPQNDFVNLSLNSYFTQTDTSFFMPFIEDQVELSPETFHTIYDARYAYFQKSIQKGISLQNRSKFEIFDRNLILNYAISHSGEKLYQPKDKDIRIKKKNYPKDANGELYERNAKRDEFSHYVLANYEIFDDFSADLSFRQTITKTKDYNPLIEFLGYNPQGGLKIKKTYTPPLKHKSFDYSFGLNKKFQNLILYSKFSQISRAPSLFQLSRGYSQQNASGDNLASLKPEKARNLEIGANFYYDDKFGLKFAFFNNDIKDFLTRTNILKSDFMQTTNIKSALFRGFEGQMDFKGEIFYSQFGFTKIIKTKFCKAKNQLKNGDQVCFTGGISGSNISNSIPPKHTFYALLGAKIFDFDFGAKFSHFSERFVSIWDKDNSKGETNSAQWDSYNLIDLYADFIASKNLKIKARIDNLQNIYYLDANNMGLNPAPGRTFHLSFEYKF